MNVVDPTLGELREIARRHYLDRMTDEDFEALSTIIGASLESHRRIDEMDDSQPTDLAGRDLGRAPTAEENPFNGWVWRSTIKGSSSGPLVEKTLAIKDNVALAGLPMRIGADLLDGFVPDEDATIVTRILAAGGTITGKSACEYLSFSGSSFTADTGPVLNPHDRSRSAGGSSCGSAALVAAGAVDIASGGDQSGSIRIPASFCGVYGFKPSYGLVPATGVAPIEVTVDHIGPIAASVRDITAFMVAVSGEDPLDPRQRESWSGRRTPDFSSVAGGDVRGLRIGIVDEGFGWATSESDVDSAVEAAARSFEQLGASVSFTSVPMHLDGAHINSVIQMEGANTTMLRGNGAGSGWKGRYPRRLIEALGSAKQTRSEELSDMMKQLVLLGEYLTDKYHGTYYAKAQNLALDLTAAYDAALTEFDILVMPTTPMKATPIPGSDVERVERFGYVLNMVSNTSPTCVTGHPSISVPCGFSDGLPVGMMLTGRRHDDATVLRAAAAFEMSGLHGDVYNKGQEARA